MESDFLCFGSCFRYQYILVMSSGKKLEEFNVKRF